MRIGIAKIIRRRIVYNKEVRRAAEKYDIENAKEWCRECIKKRVVQDSLNADLDSINYNITEELINGLPGYRITATLDF